MPQAFYFFLIFYCEICCCMPVIRHMFVENHHYLTNGYYVFPMCKALRIKTKIKCASYIQGLSLLEKEAVVRSLYNLNTADSLT